MDKYETDVGIIDYGINNLKSISKAFEILGKNHSIISTGIEINKAKCLVLPGVGAFSDGMKGLAQNSLIEPIKENVVQGKPLLGICLGMQMLFSESEEFGIHQGLNLIPGRVVSFKNPIEVNIKGYKIPHVAWNNINIPKFNENKDIWKNTLLENTKSNSDVYFVHSFYPEVHISDYIIATSEYGNQEFCAVVKKKNITGTQFHPEKSGKTGIDMLKTFCDYYGI